MMYVDYIETTLTAGERQMTKSRITRKEVNELYNSKKTVAEFRALADAGDVEAKKIVKAARESIARLTAKRDNKIWL